ncbi:hypothetical protein PAPHI01_1787 [Pancytospora philotis]|nr:hypothetical protein PAPHI01_1787 [Pancytospora philotis]
MKEEHLDLLANVLTDLGVSCEVFTDKFTPEQIFYQLQLATEAKLSGLEGRINADYENYLKKADIAREKAAALGGAECEDSADNIESCDGAQTSESASDSETSASESELGAEPSETASTESASQEGPSDGSAEESDELLFASEDEEELSSVDWNGSYSSADELLDKPAGEIYDLLFSKKNKK